MGQREESRQGCTGSSRRFHELARRAAPRCLCGPSRNLQAADELLEKARVREQSGFYSALEALLEVLPVSTHFSGIELEGDVREFGSDFEALENLRRLSFSEDVDEPEQLKLWKEETQGE